MEQRWEGVRITDGIWGEVPPRGPRVFCIFLLQRSEVCRRHITVFINPLDFSACCNAFRGFHVFWFEGDTNNPTECLKPTFHLSLVPGLNPYFSACQDSSDTKNAFTHAANMLKELKTTQLSPRNYYELYMKVV